MKLFYTICLCVVSLSFLNGQDYLLTFDHDAGYYDTPFELIISSSVPNAEIKYTFDGSDPGTSANVISGITPVSLTVNPSDTSFRGKSPAVVVRAITSTNWGYLGETQTKTYIFENELSGQTDPGYHWPEEAYQSVNNHYIDYSMDSKVVNDEIYAPQVIPAFHQLPVISLATENQNLFDAETGIWVNSQGRGEEWEIPISFEIIGKSGQEVQVNAGLRLKGGWSRQQFNPKYSLRVLFKGDYGPTDLEYPLFGEDGAQEFDHIELRTEQNCGYQLDGGIAQYNTFLRDIFARDAQRDLDHAYIRSEYYHLFINGMYWGIYMTHERVNEDYAVSYFEGDDEDYDINKANDVVNGDIETWRKLWQLSNNGFSDNSSFFKVIGRDAQGNRGRGQEIYADLDNLIDYMSIVFYTGNFDGPVSAWSGNRSGANFIALTDRTDRSFGYQFFAVDFEYSMMVDAVYVGAGLEENRVTIPSMNTSSFGEFNPQWLHHKLAANPEYRIRFMDRAYYLFEESGPLSPDKNLARLVERENQIDTAIVLESARWGDAQQDSLPLTKADWVEEVSSLKEVFIPNRTDIVINQLLEADLYSTLTPPYFLVSGQLPADNSYYLAGSEEVSIINPGDGTVYYTLNGNDPRAIGGEPSEMAESFEGPEKDLTVSSTTQIRVRAYSGDDWSPLRTINLLQPAADEDYSALKVTELNYHPVEDSLFGEHIDGDDFEFIEFKNTGTTALNISGLRIDSAISYIAPSGTILLPDEYYVVVDKPATFYNRYGEIGSGNFGGNLSNSGEYVLVQDSLQNEILSFTYSDADPWPAEADGDGYSLVAVERNPAGDPNEAEYWTVSDGLHGNPFNDTTIIPEVPVSIPSFTYNVNIYPNPTSGKLILDAEGSSASASVVLLDAMGRICYSGAFNGYKIIDFNSMRLAKGIYHLKITEGRSTGIKRIVYY